MVPRTKIKLPIRTIVIANITEYYEPIFCQFQKEEKIRSWIKPSQSECDMAILWKGDDKLVVLPKKIEDGFVHDLVKLHKYTNVHIAYPENGGESLCSDIQNDTKLFDFMIDVIKCSEVPDIISWGATKAFYSLLQSLAKTGGKFGTPEIPPKEDYWTVPYLDSKIGFREMYTKLSLETSGCSIAPGLICGTTELSSSIIRSNYFQDAGIVIKSNVGVGGDGTLIYRKERLGNLLDFDKKLDAIQKLIPIFSLYPLLIEKYISSQSTSVLSSPSIQGLISPSGKVDITALTGQIIDKTGRYIGSIISPDLFPLDIKESLFSVGQKLGAEASRLGYRGVFNFDTILTNDGRLYFVEMNARRTSIKYVLDMAKQLFGETWTNKISIISNERFSSEKLKKFSYNQIKSLLSCFLFPISGKYRGVIITIISSLIGYAQLPQLGFVVVGDNFSVTQSIYSEVLEVLNQ